MDIYYRIYKLENHEITYETRDVALVYERFSSCMIARFVNHAPGIKRVVSSCNYDGTYSYKFYGDNKMVYEFRIAR